MPANVFISYDHDDHAYFHGLRGVGANSTHPLEFDDRSLLEPVKDKAGNIIMCPPYAPGAEKVKEVILKHFHDASRLLVLVGVNTHQSKWVNWEIDAFYRQKQSQFGGNLWTRIRGMRIRGAEKATLPPLLATHGNVINWNPDPLIPWFKNLS